MNDPMIIAAAIVLVIAAVGSMFVQIINARAAAEDRRQARDNRIKLETLAEVNDKKSNKIIEQGVAIHTSTNSNLSKVTSDLSTALSKIEGLEKIILFQDKAKDIADSLARERKQNIPFTPTIPLPIPIQIVDEEKKEGKE